MNGQTIRRIVCCVVVAIGVLFAATGCFLFGNRPPVASFVIRYNIEADPMIVELDATSSSDPDGDAITVYMWTFGEDVVIPTPLDYSKTLNEPIVQVRYPTEGEYPVQLLVIDEGGLASEAPAMQTVVLPNPAMEPTL